MEARNLVSHSRKVSGVGLSSALVNELIFSSRNPSYHKPSCMHYIQEIGSHFAVLLHHPKIAFRVHRPNCKQSKNYHMRHLYNVKKKKKKTTQKTSRSTYTAITRMTHYIPVGVPEQLVDFYFSFSPVAMRYEQTVRFVPHGETMNRIRSCVHMFSELSRTSR